MIASSEHQDGADDPVLNEREAQDFLVPEDLAEFLILDLGQRRVHHEDKADGNGNVGRADLEAVDEVFSALDEIPEAHA